MEIKENYSSNGEPVFDRYIKELYKLKSENEKIANNVAKKGLEELGMTSYTPQKNSLGINTEWGLIVGICILIACCGFLLNSLASIPMYIGGLAFFLAGLFIGLNIPIFGLIFLFLTESSFVSSNLSTETFNISDIFLISSKVISLSQFSHSAITV